MPPSSERVRLPITIPLAMMLGGMFFAASGVTRAEFTGTTANATSFTAQRIFVGDRTTSVWHVSDQSSGSAVDRTDFFSEPDNRPWTMSTWSTSFSSSRFIDFDFSSPLPAGLSTSGVTFNYRFSAGSGSGCFYLEVRRRSTGALIATHGSTAQPVFCSSTSGAWNTVSTPLSGVTSTDVANDLRIRIFGRNSRSLGSQIDLATITGSTPHASFTLHRQRFVDQADGSPTTDTWPLYGEADGVTAASAAPWSTAFSSTRYFRVVFPAYVPAGATVSAATMQHAYRSASVGAQTCNYVEVYSGTTLIGTHGSASAPFSCNATTSFVSDSIPLPEVDTAAESNALSVRVYMRNSGVQSNDRYSDHDRLTLTLRYALD